MSGYVTASVVLKDDDIRGPDDIYASTGRDSFVAVHIAGLSVIVASHTDDGVALQLADAVLAAVTEWHAEIHRRGHANPVGIAPEAVSP